MLRVRFAAPSGGVYGLSIERLSSAVVGGARSFYDWTSHTFKTAAWAVRVVVPPDSRAPAEGSGETAGEYAVTLDVSTGALAAQFTDGQYVVSVHDTAQSNAVVLCLEAALHGGDDSAVGLALASDALHTVVVDSASDLRADDALALIASVLAGKRAIDDGGSTVYYAVAADTVARVVGDDTGTGRDIQQLIMPG